jgi:phosphohistidine phosphatase SixA
MTGGYAVVFVSPAQRAAETAAWFLRALGEQLPSHDVIPCLAGKGPEGDAPSALGECVRGLLRHVPEGERGLAVGHTPLIETAVLALTGREVDPLAECEGVLLTEESEGELAVEELRLAPR